VHGTLLAIIYPDNTPHGYNLTFAFPMLLFIIVAGTLYLILSSSHHVPGHVALESTRWAQGAAAATPASAAAAATMPPAKAQAPADDPDATQTVQAEHAEESTEGGE
jgi:hypothetical protein